MDPELKRAACAGNVEFLKKAIASQPPHYLLTEWSTYNGNVKDEGRAGNILHLAVWDKQEEFIRQALEVLPTDIALELLSQPVKAVRARINILHKLAWCNHDWVNLGMTRVVLNYYRSYSGPPLTDAQKPWLALNTNNSTPLHASFTTKNSTEEIAMELFSMDGTDKVCAIVNKSGISPLFGAIQKRYTQIVEKILMSSWSYSLAAPNGSSPLHLAPTCSSELVVKLLLSKHPELIDCVDDNGCNVLHKWLEMDDSLWVLELLDQFPEEKKKIYQILVCQTTEKERGDTPLHIAARNSNAEIVQIVVREYQQQQVTSTSDEISIEATNNKYPPWKIKNYEGKTPFQVAIESKQEQIALLFLSINSALCDIYDNTGQSPLLNAVGHGCAKVVAEILRIHKVPPFTMLRRNDGMTLLHFLPFIPEEAAKRMLEKFWWIMNLTNDKGRTALDEAKEANTPWLVNLLMNHSLIHKEPFDWITSCEKGETAAVLAFIDNCQDLHKLYLEQNDTVLHHIKLDTYKEYKKLLKNPAIVELKNATNLNDKTPLHCAIERKDIHLVKALLVDGVERNIKDSNGTTAMKLLATLYNSQNPDWKKMCKDIKVNPLLKTTYIQPGTDVGAMRNTLSVVAALLATITFAAGFTLPGGYNENTGDAIKAKKAAFLVFLISDAYAMCASMLVLFCLIWSMVSTQDMSYLLVDRSVLILMQSLYGTMIAFITGIYAVTSTHSLWAAILVIVMCSVVVISANRTFLHIILSKLIPAAASEDQTPKVQQESTTANGNNSSMNPTLSTANQEPKGHMSVLESV